MAEWAEMRVALLDPDVAALKRYEEPRREKELGRLQALRCERHADWLRQRGRGEKDRSATTLGEYVAVILHTWKMGQPRVVSRNVMNKGLIENLPDDCCIEVLYLVGGNEGQPVRVGSPQLVAIMQTKINRQQLKGKAALTGRPEHRYDAALMDPHTAAELDPEEIVKLSDGLLAAHR